MLVLLQGISGAQALALPSQLGNCGPEPLGHRCQTSLREGGYGMALTAFCLKHSQDKGLKKGKVTSTAESVGSKGEGGHAEAGSGQGDGLWE